MLTGPLLYHFSDMVNEWSVELPYEDIRRITTDHFKFEILVSFDHATFYELLRGHFQDSITFQRFIIVNSVNCVNYPFCFLKDII